MADDEQQPLVAKIHRLSNLELALLLSLVAREHCLISTPTAAVDLLVEELRLISINTFRLQPAVISCNAHTTLDDFATALLVHAASPVSPVQQRSSSHHHDPAASYFSPQPGAAGGGVGSRHYPSHLRPHHQHPYSPPTPAQIANVVIAKNLDLAPRAVQIQALELLRTRRVFTRSAVHAAPRQFLFIAAVGAEGAGHARVTPHLNDFLYLAHWHDPEEEEEDRGGEERFAGLDTEGEDRDADDGEDGASTTSSESVVKSGVAGRPRTGSAATSDYGNRGPFFTEKELSCLAELGQKVRVDVDVIRYQMNIVSYLRMHRAVAGGITPTATKHFERLMKSLAPLHGLDYVTPALVALAARKVYLHRIKLVAPEHERSMQWGSDLAAVEAILEGVGPEEVIEDVLEVVAAPV